MQTFRKKATFLFRFVEKKSFPITQRAITEACMPLLDVEMDRESITIKNRQT